MSYWSTVELNEQYVDEANECGLGAGVTIKVTLVCDCYPGEDECDEPYDARAELKEVLFVRIFAADGSPIYSRLGCNAIELDSHEWNTLYEFVRKKASESWSELEPKALAADPVEFFSQEDEYGYGY